MTRLTTLAVRAPGDVATERPLIRCLQDSFLRYAERCAVVVPGGSSKPARELTFQELWLRAARLATALERDGLETGRKVLLLADSGPGWLVADLALLGLGCPDVPRGTEAPATEIEYIAGVVEAPVAFVDGPALLERLPSGPGAPQRVVLLTGSPDEGRPDDRVVTLDEIIDSVEPDEALAHFDAQVARREPGETATVVFTSGTTGRPKGVILTQANLGANLMQALSVIEFIPDAATNLSILPAWHMFERVVEYALLALGGRLVFSSRRTFTRDLASYEPDVLGAVPRLWMMLAEGVRTRAARAGPVRRTLLRIALVCAGRRARARRVLRGRLPRFGPVPAVQLLRRAADVVVGTALLPLAVLLDGLVVRRVRQALGLRRLVRGAAISGGGSLPDDVDLFFESLGLELLNGYGLTETSPVLCLRLPQRNVVGTVGPPLPRTELEIRDPETGARLPAGRQGVVHAHGPQVMAGYHQDEAGTELVLDADGWFDTGDLGRQTTTGELHITGRLKDTIVLLSGENVDPEPLENALASSPLIQQALVVGQDRKYLGALIVPDYESLHSEGGAPGSGVQEWSRLLREEIDRKVHPRHGFRQHERIVRFQLLERPFSVEDQTLSPTLKVRRPVVHERFARNIDDLYRDSGALPS